jgi:iron complex outermembrane recepter protein
VNKQKCVISLIAGATLAGLPAAMALAADAVATETLEEVVVTAQNRVENVQRVPIAINVVSAEKIAETGFASLNDIQKVAPAVQLINDNNALRVTVRGVGSNTNGETDDTSVVLNVDGEYINRGTVLGASMFDIERIEVLRGPQGTLYGRNSTGGAINIITRKPGDKFGFNASSGFGNYGATNVEAGIDMPLGTIGGVRLAGIYNDHEGYYTHPANNIALVQTPASTSGIERNSAGRVSVQLKPTDAFSINLAGEYGKRFFVNPAADTVDLHVPGNAPAGPGCNAAGFVNVAPLYASLAANPYYACVPVTTNYLENKDRNAAYAQPWYGVGGYNQTSRAFRARLVYEFSPAATLSYIGGYRSSGQSGDQGLPVIYHTVQFQLDVKTQSHELRLNGQVGKVDYQVGVFHFEEKINSDGGFAIDGIAFGQAPPGRTQGFLSYFTRDQVSKSDSAFGQLEFGMTDTLKAQVGLRYTKNKRSAVYGNSPFPVFALGVLGVGRQNLDTLYGNIPHRSTLGSDESKTTGLVGLNYTPDDRTLIYGKVSTGFKGGGFDQVGQFNPETNTAYEVGLKKNFGASGQHYFNASAFSYQYKDLQVSALLNPAVGGQTFNAGKASISGLELEGGYRPTENDSLTASVNYLRSKFDQFLGIYNVYCVPASTTSAACNSVTSVPDLNPVVAGVQSPDFAGNTPANSPKLVATLGYDHTFRLGNGDTLKASLFERYKSSYFTDFYNYNDAKQKAYHQTDVSLEYKSGHFSVQGYVRNVEDYRPLINAYFIAAGPDDIFNFWYGQPRIYGVKVGVTY